MIFTPLASSSHGNAYVLDDGRTRILIECGLPFRRLQRLVGFAVSDFAACLISHEHKDHAYCHKELLKSGVEVYASRGTAQELDCDLLTELALTEDYGGGYEEFSVGSFDVKPFATFHDAAEPVGYLIRSTVDGERLVFATDTVNLGYKFPGVNLVALECNHAEELIAKATRMPEKTKERIQNTHMEVGRVCLYLEKLDKSQCRCIYLLHLSNACANEGQFLDLVKRVCPGIAVIVCPRG